MLPRLFGILRFRDNPNRVIPQTPVFHTDFQSAQRNVWKEGWKAAWLLTKFRPFNSKTSSFHRDNSNKLNTELNCAMR